MSSTIGGGGFYGPTRSNLCLFFGDNATSGICLLDPKIIPGVSTNGASFSPAAISACVTSTTQFSAARADASLMVAGGIAGSIAATIVAWILQCCRVRHVKDPTRDRAHGNGAVTQQLLGGEWKANARGGSALLLAAFAFQTFSLFAGITALFIPWWSGGYSLSSTDGSFSTFYATVNAVAQHLRYCTSTYISPSQECVEASKTNVPFVGGAAIVIVSLVAFVVPAWLLAAVAGVNLERVVRFNALPSFIIAGLPAIQGLSWASFTFFAAGEIYFVTASASLSYQELLAVPLAGVPSVVGQPTLTDIAVAGIGAGASLLTTAVAANFIASTLFSVAGCCWVGSMPGIGMSRTSCCLTEPCDMTESDNGDTNTAGSGGDGDMIELCASESNKHAAPESGSEPGRPSNGSAQRTTTALPLSALALAVPVRSAAPPPPPPTQELQLSPQPQPQPQLQPQPQPQPQPQEPEQQMAPPAVSQTAP